MRQAEDTILHMETKFVKCPFLIGDGNKIQAMGMDIGYCCTLQSGYTQYAFI